MEWNNGNEKLTTSTALSNPRLEGAHTAKGITIPDNIELVFQPPYSPELNPIKRLWQYLKDELAWMCYETLEALRLHVRDLLNQLSRNTLPSA
ncbi:transposase [Cyanobacteria bacterium FACHB-63]|nr:transposase [Cyanobacteria bacterium FACHB-63]